MSNYHIREVQKEENSDLIKTVGVVFHIPIPALNNIVGVPYRDALVAYLGGADAITSVLPEVRQTPEEADMKAGAILEVSTTVRFTSTNLTDAQRLTQVEMAFITAKATELAIKQLELKYFGKVGDVA